MLPFRHRLTCEQRIKEYRKIRDKKPEYTPVIVERGNRETPQIDKEKFLVHDNLVVSQFLHVLRRRLSMKSSDALFLLCNNRVLVGEQTLKHISNTTPPSEDGFLYVTYTLENAFGT